MDKHDIESYLRHIGATVPARRSGWVKMRCPFHDDGTASSAVNFDINRFKCHACGVAGDTYDLIIHDRGGTLSEAIEFAQTISPESDTAIRKPDRVGKRLSIHKASLGRRGSSVSLGGSRRSTARS